MKTLLQGKTGPITLAALIVVAAAFWSTSRYPSLGDKASEGSEIKLEDPLVFEALVRVEPSDPITRRIGFTTLNWISANRQGMFFGVIFAAGFMTLFAQLRQRSLRDWFTSTLMGLAIGAPLGGGLRQSPGECMR